MKKQILFVVLNLLLFAGNAAARSAGAGAYLNSLDLNLSQYNERIGLSMWIFNQNMAQAGMSTS